jgi:hypothetical protein
MAANFKEELIMATIKLKRGQSANLPSLTLEAGEPAFTLDTKKLYVGDGTEKVLINPDIGNHLLKPIALFGIGGTDTFIGVDPGKYPISAFVDVLCVVVYLGFVAGKLFLRIC